jgi:hypothetical protein
MLVLSFGYCLYIISLSKSDRGVIQLIVTAQVDNVMQTVQLVIVGEKVSKCVSIVSSTINCLSSLNYHRSRSSIFSFMLSSCPARFNVYTARAFSSGLPTMESILKNAWVASSISPPL